jgi:hypothetical protein
MENLFDFYSVEICSPRKRSIYNALGKKVSYSDGLKSRKVKNNSVFPKYEYAYNVGFASMMNSSPEKASAKANEIANKYRDMEDVRVLIKYHCRD